MNNIKKYLPLIVRIIISGLFLLSAIAKSFPIWAFEKQLVDLGLVDWCIAPYFARLIIALEIAIAIGILQRHYLKTFVIPLTFFLLIAFCVHLGILIYQHGNSGNCGCFGQLIPMTPLQAIIKNIFTIGLVVYLFKNVSNKAPGQNNFIYILFIYLLSAFIMFFFFPFCPCAKTETQTASTALPSLTDSLKLINDTTAALTNDSIQSSEKIKDTVPSKKIKATDTSVSKNPVVAEPVKTTSKFAPYNDFNGKKVSLDEGKKIVCLFVPGCDHCRDAAKELVQLSKKHKLPPVYILFMNEETFKIPEFFKETNALFPYSIINDIPGFFKLLGTNATTPGVVYLWNGNIIRSYEGIDKNKFNAEEMIKAIESNQK